ncbi:MAG TPA: hypothetical protein VI636_17865 [Candidatus Angelobacter sp.]
MWGDKTGRIKAFDIRQLRPFHRENAHLPAPTTEEEDKIAELDPNLKPEEHSYVNHYIHYADVLLNQDEDKEREPVQEPPGTDKDAEAMREPPPPRKVLEMPQKVEDRQSGKPKKKDGEGTPRCASG